MKNKFSQPGIFYEETHEGLTNGFPFMEIEKEKSIPNVLFIGAVQDTDEQINESEVVKEVVMQSYFNSEAIKRVLDEDQYNNIKKSLGLTLVK